MHPRRILVAVIAAIGFAAVPAAMAASTAQAAGDPVAATVSSTPTPTSTPATQKAGPDILVNQEYDFQNVGTGLWLRTPAGGGVVYDSTGATVWISQNLHNSIYVQLRAIGTNNDCMWWTGTNSVTTKTCSTSNGYDYWNVPDVSAGRAWFKPFNNSSAFATDDAGIGQTNHYVYLEGGGYGNYAVWAYVAE